MLEEMISVEELARIVGWHPMTIYRKARDGEIPGVVKLGRSVRFRESIVQEWLNKSGVEQEQQAQEEQPPPGANQSGGRRGGER